MSTPGGGAAQGQQAAPAQAQRQQQAPAQGQSQPAQAQQQPGAQPSPGRGRQRLQALTSSTPRMLRLARGAAAAAALLTGVVATGTFSTDGVNATPNVIAQQWVSAERAGVEIAQADLLAAERVAGDTSTETVQAFDQAVGTVSGDLTRIAGTGGGTSGTATEAATSWSSFVTGAERAARDLDADTYASASTSARSAAAATDTLAAQHATDLDSGSRAGLMAFVGLLSTILLVLVMVWLALRTRRIVNVPLLVATAITAGLTYLSLNPASMPVNYDQRVTEAAGTAETLQAVYQARQSQVAATLGLEGTWDEDSQAVTDGLRQLDAGTAQTAWSDWRSLGQRGATGDLTAQEALTSSAQDFTTVEQSLRGQLEEQLDASATDVARPAAITSLAAALLGLVGAALAWVGLTQRLRDYR